MNMRNYIMALAIVAMPVLSKPVVMINKTGIELAFGDITKQADVQAVVNAAKPELTGGAGVDGAMHKAAGPELLKYILDTIPADNKGERCPTGQARVTPGFKLKAACVVHAVGPRGNNPHRKKLLSDAYASILNAKDPKTNTVFSSLALPMISTGIYGYPREEATEIAIAQVVRHALNNPDMDRKIRFVFFDDENGKESFALYKKILSKPIITRE